MYISHKAHNTTVQVYFVTVMTHVKVLDAGQSSQGTPEPITMEDRRTLCLLYGPFGTIISRDNYR